MGKIVIIQIHILFLIFITIKYTHSLHSSLTHELSLTKPLFVFFFFFSLFLFLRRDSRRRRWWRAAATTVESSVWPRTIVDFSSSSYPFRFSSVPATQAGESQRNRPLFAHTGSDMNSGEFYFPFIPILLRFVQGRVRGRKWSTRFGFINCLKNILNFELGCPKWLFEVWLRFCGVFAKP